MAYSLKNHEDRIKNLESKIASSGGIVESKLANPGYAKFANGLIVNFGYTGSSSGATTRTVTYAKPHTTAPSFLVSMRSGGSSALYNSFKVTSVTATSASFYNNANESSAMSWIAIGY